MLRDLPVKALQAFALVYEHRGVRSAARELHIAHSALSRHVRELTRWAGVPLIREGRGRGGIQFTPQGEALGQATLAALRSIEHSALAVREGRGTESVTIETSHSVAVRWLLPRLAAFGATNSKVEVSVVADQKVRDPDGSTVDFTIRMGQGPWSEVDCMPLMSDALYPVMSPQLWRRLGKPNRARDLLRAPLLHDRDPHASWELWRKAMGPPALDIRRGPRFSSSDLVLRAAAHGQGIALARDRLVRDEIIAGSLVRPFGPAQVDIGISYWIVRPEHRRARPAASAVTLWLKELVETEDVATVSKPAERGEK
jgi:LysR family glycine cleavage system transcriptional activator